MAAERNKPFVVRLELAETTASELELQASEDRIREISRQAAVNRLIRMREQGEERDEHTKR